jgi:AmmeMemoRadiSam system protein B
LTIKRIYQQTEQSKNEFSTVCPELRPGLEPIPVKDEEGHIFIDLHDQLNLSANQVLLPQDLFFLLQFFDGSHSTLDLRAEYMRKFGTFLYMDRLEEFLHILDQNYFLKNKKYAERLNEINTAFRSSPVRLPVCAGSSYSQDPEQLHLELDRLTDRVTIPSAVAELFKDRAIQGCIVPHIDIRTGGPVYAPVYHMLSTHPQADLYVILGIAHQGINNLFSLTCKNFQTPIGMVHTEKDVVNRINSISGFDFQQEEFIHQNEHSIEFQTVFLRQFIKSDFKILPVLCSFTPYALEHNRQLFDRFLNALQTALTEFKGSVCYIASVDFAHVGIRYGDDQSPTATFLAQVERNDRELFQALVNADYDLFQNLIYSTHDRYRICGYSALTTLLSLLPEVKGRLLAYGSAIMDEQRSTVTFASMVF